MFLAYNFSRNTVILIPSVRETLTDGFLKAGISMTNKYNRIFSILLILFGNLLYAMTVKFFVLPANLMSCGTTGIALVINHLTKIPLPLFILIFNLVMLAVGWLVLGKQFAITTIFSSLFYPFALECLDLLAPTFYITDNRMLNVVFAGIGLGVSLGMVMRGGASTGGMDIPPLILQKFFRIPVSATLWAFDFCILLAQMLFHPLEDLLFGILLIIVISIALNKTMLLGTSKTEVKIISAKACEIREGILSRIDRGVTLLRGEGGYLRNDTDVILSVVSNHELARIERLARSIDPACFMIINRVTEVWGRGFSYDKQQPHPKVDQ